MREGEERVIGVLEEVREEGSASLASNTPVPHPPLVTIRLTLVLQMLCYVAPFASVVPGGPPPAQSPPPPQPPLSL